MGGCSSHPQKRSEVSDDGGANVPQPQYQQPPSAPVTDRAPAVEPAPPHIVESSSSQKSSEPVEAPSPRTPSQAVAAIETNGSPLQDQAGIESPETSAHAPVGIAAELNEDQKKQFCKAVEDSDEAELARLLEETPGAVYVSPWNADTGSLLHMAAECGAAELVSLLIVKGALASAVDGDLKTPLHVATENGQVEAVKALMTQPICPEIGMEDRYQMTPFHLAVEEGNPEVIMALLMKLNEKGSGMKRKQIAQLRRGSAMFIAERTGRSDIVEMLKQDNAANGFMSEIGFMSEASQGIAEVTEEDHGTATWG